MRLPGSRLMLACVITLLACLPITAIDRDRRVDQLYHTSWTMKDGAPNEIFAIAQTTDGYLWLGTTAGLVRFDGVRFQNYEPPAGHELSGRTVGSLLALPDNALLVGFGSGGLNLIQRGSVMTYTERDGVPSGSVRGLARDGAGRIWLAALGGLAVSEGTRWKAIGAEYNFSGGATSVMVDHRGTVWVGTQDSVFSLPEGSSQFQKVADHLENVARLAEAADGTIWMAELGRAIRQVPRRGAAATPKSPRVPLGSIAMLFDHEGSLWATSLGSGIRRIAYPERQSEHGSGIAPPEDAFTQKQGLSSDNGESIFEDHEGNIWIGTNAGLDRFRQSTAVFVPLLASTSYKSLMAGDQGAVWVGVAGRSLFQIRPSGLSVKPSPALNPVRNAQSNCIYRDPQGTYWVATTDALLRISNGRVDHIAYPAGPRATPFERNGTPVTMTAAGSDGIWVSILGNGVFRLEHTRWTGIEKWGGPAGIAISAFTDSIGRVWLGYSNKTIVLIDGRNLRMLTGQDGVSVGKVRCFHGRGSSVWAGGDEGVALFDGQRFHPLFSSTGAPFRDVFGIVETANDGLWFSDHSGIVHVSDSDIRAFKNNPARKVDHQVFSLLDGLLAPLQRSSVVPSVIEGADGLLWFATTQGVAWVDPKRISRNTLPPPVSIEWVVADGKRYDPAVAFVLPPRTANLSIAYTGLSLSVPERVQFRYKLEGSDHDWQSAGTRRDAFYTNPGPGSYRFHVIACNSSDVWNETGAVLSFSIMPAFYQTAWFEALCVLASAALLWLLYLLRLEQATARIRARLGERLVERERIARELHDTLLQGFSGLVLRFQAVMKQLPAEGPSREMMEKSLERADQILLEGRLRVRNLRSETTMPSSLAESLANCGEELSNDSPISFSLAVAGTPRSLARLALEEACLIGREAMMNAFQHSKASKIEVEISYDAANLRLRVRDDGSGIDQNILNEGRSGHWGLLGLRERAQNIGGRLNIWSKTGAGTEIDLTIPSKIAYRMRNEKSRRSWVNAFSERRSTEE